MDTMQALRALLDPASRPDPYPLYARLRDAGPTWVESVSALVVARYADCDALLRDPRLSAERGRDQLKHMARVLPADAPSSVLQPWFLSLDPPDHTRLRRLVSKAFTARSVARMESSIAVLTDELLDAAADRTHMDVVADLAYPLPMTVICRLLGVPMADEPLFRDWSARLTRLIDGFDARMTSDDTMPGWLHASVEMHRYVSGLVDARRSDPGDDLISELLAIRHEGDTLTHDELISTVVLLLVAGHETTVNLIANSVLALLRCPDRLSALRDDPTTAPALVEETLRFDPPVQLTARVVSEDAEICGVPLSRGSFVYLMLAAAHRDPSQFDRPDVFDPNRTDLTHLAFGLGPHFCLGAPLARLEARIALTRFAQRVIDPAASQDPPPYREHLNLRGPRALPLTHSGIRPAGQLRTMPVGSSTSGDHDR
ncbi:cytochrome P450 [Kibdelosporangium aridum]|uniref:cytochrome P450 n=1 Tax=Kibdelosporangium aridum TaxID=2030 RepID=UPI0007C5C85D